MFYISNIDVIHSMSFGKISLNDFLKFLIMKEQYDAENDPFYDPIFKVQNCVFCHAITYEQLTPFLQEKIQEYDQYNQYFSFFEICYNIDNTYYFIQYILVTNANNEITDLVYDSYNVYKMSDNFMTLLNNYDILQNMLIKYKNLFDFYNINIDNIFSIGPINDIQYTDLYNVVGYNLLNNGMNIMQDDYNKIHIYNLNLSLDFSDSYYLYVYIDEDTQSAELLDIIPYHEDDENNF